MQIYLTYILFNCILRQFYSDPIYQYQYRNQQNPNADLLRTNLLFIMFDDLRPELNVYGKQHMITPNFDRLARKSVTFEHAYSQLAVCNPSRDSMLTGLRPDTVGTYAFQSIYRPHLIFPQQLVRSGFLTAGFGKIRHYEDGDTQVWNYANDDAGWYDYQALEWSKMNSSILPDKTTPEHKFRDYMFASKTITALENLSKQDNYFMVGVGFKNPHLCLHVPYRTFDLYRNISDIWLNKSVDYRTYPKTTPVIGYRCCGDDTFKYMNKEGEMTSVKSDQVVNKLTVAADLYKELMWGYAASITFVDEQVGRILDAVDRLQLWNNLTIVLTSDHGMHNGEKGIWVRVKKS